MTVKELQDWLSGFPPDLDVHVPVCGGFECEDWQEEADEIHVRLLNTEHAYVDKAGRRRTKAVADRPVLVISA